MLSYQSFLKLQSFCVYKIQWFQSEWKGSNQKQLPQLCGIQNKRIFQIHWNWGLIKGFLLNCWLTCSFYLMYCIFWFIHFWRITFEFNYFVERNGSSIVAYFLKNFLTSFTTQLFSFELIPLERILSCRVKTNSIHFVRFVLEVNGWRSLLYSSTAYRLCSLTSLKFLIFYFFYFQIIINFEKFCWDSFTQIQFWFFRNSCSLEKPCQVTHLNHLWKMKMHLISEMTRNLKESALEMGTMKIDSTGTSNLVWVIPQNKVFQHIFILFVCCFCKSKTFLTTFCNLFVYFFLLCSVFWC